MAARRPKVGARSGRRSLTATCVAVAALAVAAAAALCGRCSSFVEPFFRSRLQSDRPADNARTGLAALPQGVDAHDGPSRRSMLLHGATVGAPLLAGARPVLAEAMPEMAPKLKTYYSKAGDLEIDVPETWRTSVDISPERLVYSYVLSPDENLFDFMAVRVEELNIGTVLREHRFIPAPEDLAASDWSVPISGAVTQELFASWMLTQQKGVLKRIAPKNAGFEGANAGPSSEGELVDSKIDGNVFTFHVRYVLNKGDEDSSYTDIKKAGNRYWTVKAILNRGIITVAYLTTAELHWLPDGGPIDGKYLDTIVNSLRLKSRTA
eukprot:TRINITY_DN103500_c0_g1_i1.p1 TRINITY_DN103500_c0_g1~~TRINITY_DN103500_c0_g1_i1.p1  ORF type:complete len:323 (+),score=41.39 TRINITY_DN103500_c0_g1_i1:62-1030(+)